MAKRAAAGDSANVPGTRMSTAFGLVIPDPVSVIPGSTRDPVLRCDWIADQVRNDKDGRNDKNMQDLVAGALSAAA